MLRIEEKKNTLKWHEKERKKQKVRSRKGK